MGKIDNWITKITRLKNSKVARFSYRAEAYANDEIEGVENYDYAQDMNVPLATHTDFDSSMLSIGARTNFSVIPKNGLNHFFGRVSYNLNKVIDFLSDLLDDFRVQGIETLRRDADFTLETYADGKKLRIANTHAANTITCTLPSGQTMNGNGTISIPAGRVIDIELLGSTWKDNLTGNLVGNADTATKLANARKINGVSFDGSSDITVADSTKAPLASPAFTGTPTAPTPAAATNNTQIATTAFVKNLASPSITGSCTTNGTTDNTLVLTGIVSALALETGDVIQITGSTDGLNDKLYTVESITDDNSIIVNYEHAGNRGNGSLKLANQTATITIKRIAKWYNAPLGLGQAWVGMTQSRAKDTTYTNTTGRTIIVKVTGQSLSFGEGATLRIMVDGLFVVYSQLTNMGSNYNSYPHVSTEVPPESIYRVQNWNTPLANIYHWAELR